MLFLFKLVYTKLYQPCLQQIFSFMKLFKAANFTTDKISFLRRPMNPPNGTRSDSVNFTQILSELD